MITYESPVSYKLIYVFSVPYEDHAGLIKIGDATIKTAASADQLPPNCSLLNTAAQKRIKQETKTAMTKYELLYTELALKCINQNSGSRILTPFRDYEVRDVLGRSGYLSKKFYDTGKPSEWYQVNLQTAKNAIKAVKEGRKVLTEAEKNIAEQKDTVCAETPESPKIILRDEQRDAIEKTKNVFSKKVRMLWDCKMRFGKTVTSCELVKQMGFVKTIVVTHRPVVAEGWKNDFHLVFGDSDDHVFLTKIKGGQEVDFDAHIDAENARTLRNLAKSGKHFMYFASMQDLRESHRVKPEGYKKNDIVFDMDWDFIIYDEAHEGTQTTLGQAVQTELEKPKKGKTPKVLSLSGTPYNIIGQYEENLYSWDYVMEQKRKREWDEKYPGITNPYADLPELRIFTFDLLESLPESYRYETEDMAFNFREFFRTWTGDPSLDYRPLPAGAKIGDFVHKADVNTFLDLITNESETSLYPFSTNEYRKMFKHTFWMLPGVKEAKAFAELLRKHKVFGFYKVVNVAGDGDEEKAYDDALKDVQAAIRENEYTITLSCGRLTTGVTVPEWTAVMLLAGSSNTAAAGYMQTIFRVQSAGSIDGKQKEICYAFDFAPDRTIKVLSEVHSIGKKSKRDDSDGRIALGEFLNFCPVLAVSGTGMHEYDVPKMMRQIKKMTVDKAIMSGFDDESVYKSDTGIVMNDKDVELFRKLASILIGQKAARVPNKISINKQGMDGEEYSKAEKAKSKSKRNRTPEEEELLKKEKEQRKERDKVIQLLRNISIRLPLLIYGAAVDLNESIHMKDFVTLVDDESWKEFMPKDVTKDLFLQVLKYYDEDVIVGAGTRIRRLAKAADELPPTRRVLRIAEIFNRFRNPDKETVLTPWRVVNMHLSDMLGGYCFYDETFDQNNGVLEEPRLVDRGDVSDAVLLNTEAKILEMNSKSGLYPLYMTYSIYAMKLTGNEDSMPIEETQKLWRETVDHNIFVLCKSKMARLITMRTLAGYQDWNVNAIYLSKLLERMKDKKRLSNKLRNPITWGKEGERMKFDAVVGNPPYQIMDGGNSASAIPIYQEFVEQAMAMEPSFISMIVPSRWFAGGRGLDKFREKMMNNTQIRKMRDFSESKYIFPTADISGGICYFLIDTSYNGKCEFTNIDSGVVTKKDRYLNEFSIIVRSNRAIDILHKVLAKKEEMLSNYVSPMKPFGLRTYEEPDKTGKLTLRWNKGKGPIEEKRITTGQQYINQWKVITSRVFYEHAGQPDKNGQYRVLSILEILKPKEICTETYIIINSYENETEAENLYNYLKTKFVRFLILQACSSIMVTKASYVFVPIVDFTKNWTDKMLYEKYSLTQDEVKFIEMTIKPMI
mgnify:CR=1 FL=1